MENKIVVEVFQRFQRQNPYPKTELDYKNPYTFLIAVVLSAQATDKGVNKATKDLFSQITTPQQMMRLGIANLKEHIKSIGLYNNKAKNIIALSEILVSNFNGEIPQDRGSLESLPGVGRKTANVILNVLFKQDTIAVDTHIFRVCNRTNLASGKTPLEVENKLTEIIPQKFRFYAHHWLILHGRYVCLARRPHCVRCIIHEFCEYTYKTGF